MKQYPLIKRVKWLGGNRVQLTFAMLGVTTVTKRVRELTLPVESAKKAHIVSNGMGLDFGDGTERSAVYVYERARAVAA